MVNSDAQIYLAVMNHDGNSIEAASFFTDVMNLCSIETDALGIYTTGTVYQPAFYHEWAEKLRTSEMPIPLWVYLGLIQDENGTSGYTYGLTEFGRDEIEVLACAAFYILNAAVSLAGKAFYLFCKLFYI